MNRLKTYSTLIALFLSIGISFATSPLDITSSMAAIKTWKTTHPSDDILDFLDDLANDIAINPSERDNHIQIFNTTISTGLDKGIDLNASSQRRNRLYEMIVNKVAPYVTDAHIWESHRILNPTAIPVSNQGKNQWRLLKRIYRQVNDPRFFGKYPDKINIQGGAHYSYNQKIAVHVKNEAGYGASSPGHGYTASSGKKVVFTPPTPSYQLLVTSSDLDPFIRYTITHQDGKIIDKQVPSKPLLDNATIRVLHVDTYEAAYEMMMENPAHIGKIAVVNFANEKDIGGGFLGGAAAQEEELCRRSNLYSQLMFYSGTTLGFYAAHIPPQGTIISPTVSVYKARDFTNLEIPYDVGVITSAADDLRAYRNNTAQLQTVQKSANNISRTRLKIQSQIASAVDMGAKVIVVGAFGAGAFLQDPFIIADLYAEEFTKFGGYFDKIVFAIISPYRDNNYKFFAERLSQTLPGTQIYDALEPQSFFIQKIGTNEILNPHLNFGPAQAHIAQIIQKTQ